MKMERKAVLKVGETYLYFDYEDDAFDAMTKLSGAMRIRKNVNIGETNVNVASTEFVYVGVQYMNVADEATANVEIDDYVSRRDAEDKINMDLI